MFTFHLTKTPIFAKLPSAKRLFFGITVNSIIQKLKSKHLVCLSLSDERSNLREFILQKVRAIVSQPGGFPTKPGGVEADQR